MDDLIDLPMLDLDLVEYSLACCRCVLAFTVLQQSTRRSNVFSLFSRHPFLRVHSQRNAGTDADCVSAKSAWVCGWSRAFVKQIGLNNVKTTQPIALAKRSAWITNGNDSVLAIFGEGFIFVVHDTVVVVLHAQRVHLKVLVLQEVLLVLLKGFDVVPENLDVVIAVWPGLLVQKADGMPQLMNNLADFSVAMVADVKGLRAFLSAKIR